MSDKPFHTPHSALGARNPPRYAIITGAGGGLGRAFALRLARQGWVLSLADIDEPAAQETLRQLREAGGDGRVDRLDVSRLDPWLGLVEQLRRQWPRLDLLVNNAGVVVAGEVGSLAIERWRLAIDTNLWGTIHGCHACVPWLKANPAGARIVNVASIMGLLAPPTLGAYNVAKAGIVVLSETLRAELARHRVGVTVVCPGFFGSRLVESGSFDTAAQREAAEAWTRRARITADDVARAALEASERNRAYVVLPRRARWLWRLKRWLPGR